MANIEYLKGDATNPQGNDNKIICHISNDIGGWGKGFVLAISKRWKQPEAEFRKWYLTGEKGGFALGSVQFIQVEPLIWVANMIGQHGLKKSGSLPPIRYEAVSQCLAQVAVKAAELSASVHMPRIGCGLAGGKWSEVEPLIQTHLTANGIAVTIYDFE